MAAIVLYGNERHNSYKYLFIRHAIVDPTNVGLWNRAHGDGNNFGSDDSVISHGICGCCGISYFRLDVVK